jgi:hypothetical protein
LFDSCLQEHPGIKPEARGMFSKVLLRGTSAMGAASVLPRAGAGAQMCAAFERHHHNERKASAAARRGFSGELRVSAASLPIHAHAQLRLDPLLPSCAMVDSDASFERQEAQFDVDDEADEVEVQKTVALWREENDDGKVFQKQVGLFEPDDETDDIELQKVFELWCMHVAL